MRGKYRKLLCNAIALVVTFSMLTAPYGQTQQIVQESQRRLLFDHEAHTANGTSVKAKGLDGLDSELFGAKIDLDTGEVTVTHTDVSIPGNSALPVEFRRIATSDPNRPNFFGNPTSAKSVGLGNFHLDAPFILLPSIKSTGTAGCVSESTLVDYRDEMYVTPKVNLPGNPQLLLKTQGTTNSAVFGSNQPSYTTPSSSKITQTKVNRNCTWTLTTTDGTKYEFGLVRVLATKAGKKKHAVLITKISDVNGNYVDFTYETSDNRLKRIKANDGREIYMSFRADGTVDCVFANTGPGQKAKEFIWWIYHFGTRTDGSGLKYLKTVTQPGTSRKWEFNEIAGITSHFNNAYAPGYFMKSGVET